MSLTFPPDATTLSDSELEALYARCFKPGHTNLFDIPGYKFGAATYIEREVFRRRILAEGWTPIDSRLGFDTLLQFEIEKRRHTFHRSDSHYRQYSSITRSKAPSDKFTVEELEHIAEHFKSANDPFVQALAEKAQRLADALSN